MNTTCPHPTHYPTDMKEAEWAIRAPYVNQDPQIGAPRTVWMRGVVTAICSLNRRGWTQRVPRTMVPKAFPKYGTGFYHYRKWTQAGTGERINTALRRLVRENAGRAPEPSLAMVDRQTVNTPEVGGAAGVAGNTQINGRKRPRLVDPGG
jgi:hypothetical protein